MVQLSILLRLSQFRLQCVKSFCRDPSVGVRYTVVCKELWVPFKTLWDNLWIPLLAFACSYLCIDPLWLKACQYQCGIYSPEPFMKAVRRLQNVKHSHQFWRKIIFYRITKTRCSSLQNACPFAADWSVLEGSSQTIPHQFPRWTLLRWKSAVHTVLTLA